jgi:hypothetical protein
MNENRLNELRDYYTELLNNTESDILLENKTLKDANRQQLNLEMDWGTLFSTVYGICNMLEIEVDEAYSHSYSKLVNDSYKSYSATEAKQVAMTDPDYIETKKLYNQFKKLKLDIEVIKDTIESRRYLLKQLTDSVINGVDDTYL